ncbi:MAG: hypothetical protein NVS4B12_21600 [Ktedonobacteraceae bacterium]
MKETKSQKPSKPQLLAIALITLIALSGAGTLGYTVTTGHTPWAPLGLSSELSPTPLPTATQVPFQTATPIPKVSSPPARLFVIYCTPQGTQSLNAVTANWLSSFSYDNTNNNTNTSTQSFDHATQRQTNYQTHGRFLALTFNLAINLTAYPLDGLVCLWVFATWPKMPTNTNPLVYQHDFTGDEIPTVTPRIQRPPSFSIVIDLDTSLFRHDEVANPNPIPKGVPVSLTFQVSTVNGLLYNSQPTETFTFTRM